MDLVKIGESPELRRQIADPRNRRDIAIHRVKRFKRNHLGAGISCLSQQLLKMVEIVMAKDPLVGAARPDAGDHRGVVFLVR